VRGEPGFCLRGYGTKHAELARMLADEGARERLLREAHRHFTEMSAPIRAEQVARELR
jgi:hypothetical protein